MASTNKTPLMGLNKWEGTDAPKRDDFNADNQKIDTSLGQHLANTSAHVSAADRTLLSAPFAAGSYTGDGAKTRNVAVGFNARIGIVYSTGGFLCEFDGDTMVNSCAFGFFTQAGGSLGLAWVSNGFSVRNVESGAAALSVPVLNRAGVKYCYVMWK